MGEELGAAGLNSLGAVVDTVARSFEIRTTDVALALTDIRPTVRVAISQDSGTGGLLNVT